MSLSGTRGLVRVSKNPECHVQAAMAIERVREPDFYRAVTGNEYPGEYGERVAARRRGHKFESRLHDNNAAGLRRALAEAYGWDAETMTVRNFADEVPGPPTTMRAARLGRTRHILQDLRDGREVPHLLIQPQFALPTGPGGGPGEHEYVSPDFAVLDPEREMYVPGEEKSFILRENVAEPGDLDLTRRQAAAQILALRAEASLVGLRDRVGNDAVFIMATPYGMYPAPPVVETLDAEIHEVRRALTTISAVRAELEALRTTTPEAKLENLIDELPFMFLEECLSSCVLASVCEKRYSTAAGVLGDRASTLLGAGRPLDDLGQLLAAGGSDPVEQELIRRLESAGEVLGLDRDELTRRLA